MMCHFVFFLWAPFYTVAGEVWELNLQSEYFILSKGNLWILQVVKQGSGSGSSGVQFSDAKLFIT